jgi:hypothetical protein
MRDGVSLTNLDQPLFDGSGAAKRDLVDYLDAVRDRILPVLADRPLSVIRVLRGQAPFMQKNVPKYTPSWVRTVELWAETSKREVSYALCNDRRTRLSSDSTSAARSTAPRAEFVPVVPHAACCARLPASAVSCIPPWRRAQLMEEARAELRRRAQRARRELDRARAESRPNARMLRVVRYERQTLPTANAGCWHALPMGIHVALTLAPACSPWRLQGTDDFPGCRHGRWRRGRHAARK